MKVYVLMHEDCPDGGHELRGIFAREEDALVSLVVLNPSGEPARSALRSHGDWCCSVLEFDVQTVPRVEVVPDDPPRRLTLIDKYLEDVISRQLEGRSWYLDSMPKTMDTHAHE